MKKAKKQKVQRDLPARFLSIFMCLGLAAGLVVGIATDREAIFLCVGMFVGTIIGAALDYSRRPLEASDFFLSEASAEDTDKLLALYSSCAGPENGWSERYPTRETIGQDISAQGLFTLRRKEILAACISVIPEDDLDQAVKDWEGSNSVVFARLAVSPRYRGRGLAKKLVKKGLELAKSRGCDSVRLLCHVSNSAALALYCSMGFMVKSRVTMYEREFYALEALL